MNEAGRGERLAYAAGGLAMNLTNLVVSQWLYVLYVPDRQGALVPAALFGAFFLLGRVTDAITDPLIAWWSDRSRSPRGRRIPFIRAGLLPFAVVFFLLWTPPVGGQHWINGLWAFVFIQLYFVLYTVVVTPYLALLPEIVRGQAARINLTTLQAVFVMAGTLIFGLLGVVIERAGWRGMGFLVSALVLVSFLPGALRVRERVEDRTDTDQPSLARWIGLTLRNEPFRFLLAATSLYWFALNLLLMLVPFWVKNVLGLEEDAVTGVMAPFLVMNLISVFAFNLLAKRIGKKAAFLLGLVGTALAVPLFLAVGSMPLWDPAKQSALVMAVIGVPVASFLMLPYALLADVVDHDERLTGQRREAIYFGVQAIAQKAMIGISVVLFGWMAFDGGSGVATEAGLERVVLVAAAAAVLAAAALVGYRLDPGGGGR